MGNLLKDVPPWMQRLITILVGLAVAVIGVKVAGLEELKKIGTGLIVASGGIALATWATPHPADAKPQPAAAPADVGQDPPADPSKR